jgi:subtilisin family serine protease
MRRPHLLTRASLLLLAFAANAIAGNWVLTLNDSTKLTSFSQQFGLGLKATLDDSNHVYLISLPDALEGLIAQALQASPWVKRLTKDQPLALPRTAGQGTQPAVVLPTSDCNGNLSKLTSAQYYLVQPATCQIDLPKVRTTPKSTLIAMVDTWVDYTHPALASFIDLAHSRNFKTGASNGLPLAQETSPVVDQETSPVVDGSGTIVLSQETSPVVDQETSPVVDSNRPAYLGHGTGVAGILHLTAPTAQIAVMDAFDVNTGTGNLSSIVAAISYAANQAHADVINMSFSLPASLDPSGTLADAVQHAVQKGVVVVASVPDFPTTGTTYLPATLPNVTAVGCSDGQCPVFNKIPGTIGINAPGYYVMAPYPGQKYALYTGTSFATPFVTGTGALINPQGNSASTIVRTDVVNSGVHHGGVLDVGVAVSQ